MPKPMDFTYADKSTPYTISPESLDWYLANGWYRMGATIFTTHFLFFRQLPYSAIWIRIDLQDFRFSKRQRKMMRRNAKLFEATTQVADLDDKEIEDLYTRYAVDFDGVLPVTVNDSLERWDNEQPVFNTQQIDIREKVSGQLVARSYYDLGATSAASILGIYDPELKTFSLGYYTMLLEIDDCLRRGMRYYYPGYVVPGYARFDYKLRLGDSQFYDLRTKTWRRYADYRFPEDGPAERQQRALEGLLPRLETLAPATAPSLKIYPLFEAPLYDIWNDKYFGYPYAITLDSGITGQLTTLIAFDPHHGAYRLYRCRHMASTQLMFNSHYLSSFAPEDYLTALMGVEELVIQVKDPEVFAKKIRRYL